MAGLKPLPALLLGLAAAGCARAPADRLLGTWTLDADATRALYGRTEQPHRLDVLATLELRITFGADTLTMEVSALGQLESKELPYRVERAGGGEVVLAATDASGKTGRMVARFDGDRLLLEDGGERYALVRE
ncbi:MAG: hypothetical protein ACE5JG_08245 [Planctomycetota bacterium]